MRGSHIPILLFLVLSSILSSCELESERFDGVSSRLTERHINIPGTRVFVVPPAFYRIEALINHPVAMTFSYETFISVRDRPDHNYYVYLDSAYEDNSKKRKFRNYKDTRINNYNAKYLFRSEDNGQKSLSIIFGDSTFYTEIVAGFPWRDTMSKNTLMRTLKSLYYDKSFMPDMISTAPIYIDAEGFNFEVSGSSRNKVYSYMNCNDDSRYIFIRIAGITQVRDPKKLTELCMSDTSLKGERSEVGEISSLDGVPAHERVFRGFDNDRPVVMYVMAMVPTSERDGYVPIIFEGYIYSEFEQNLSLFKKMARSIRFRRDVDPFKDYLILADYSEDVKQ